MHHPDDVSVPFDVNPNVCATTQKRQKGENNKSVEIAGGLAHSEAIKCTTQRRAILTSDDSEPRPKCQPAQPYRCGCGGVPCQPDAQLCRRGSSSHGRGAHGIDVMHEALACNLHITHVHIVFGTHSLLASECERVGIKKPLIVTDAGVRAAGALQMVLDALPASLQGPIYERTPSNAPSGERRARASRVLSGAVPT